ncbi:MAG: family 16 glycoside hydrolase [Planctomycetota bacterium]
MKRTHVAHLFPLVLGLVMGGTASVRAEDPVWKPLMDGETLGGWHKNGLGDWSVENGAFVGRSNKEKLYGHLVSDETFEDFTVRFKFQCTSGDSGFFIRTEMKEPDKTDGLQIQVGPCGSGTGGIYESYGRGWLQKPTKDQEAFCYREDTWNRMIITAKGPRVIVHVNGFKTADIVDSQITQAAGVFALQMHSGVVNHTMFKNVAILKQGEIFPRRFLYDAVETVEPTSEGSLVLHAAAAMTEGPKIVYMPAWGAIGQFTDQGHVYWPVKVEEAGTYDVRLEWSADPDHAGNPFLVRMGAHQLKGDVAATGSWDTYNTAKIGQLKLQAGTGRVELRPAGQFDTLLMNLRKIKLVKAN